MEALHAAGEAYTLQIIGDALYWFEARDRHHWNTLVRMPKTGGAAEVFAKDPDANASFIAGDAAHVYWASVGGIRRKER